ncbi:hypothetical protein ACP70R_002774 [Stipagrostis hirtigluma subsp. patula]
MMKQWFDKCTATSEQQTKLLQEMSSMRLKVQEEMRRAEEERIRAEQEMEKAEINQAIQVALEDGVDETSAEYFALTNICTKKESRVAADLLWDDEEFVAMVTAMQDHQRRTEQGLALFG